MSCPSASMLIYVCTRRAHLLITCTTKNVNGSVARWLGNVFYFGHLNMETLTKRLIFIAIEVINCFQMLNKLSKIAKDLNLTEVEKFRPKLVTLRPLSLLYLLA